MDNEVEDLVDVRVNERKCEKIPEGDSDIEDDFDLLDESYEECVAPVEVQIPHDAECRSAGDEDLQGQELVEAREEQAEAETRGSKRESTKRKEKCVAAKKKQKSSQKDGKENKKESKKRKSTQEIEVPAKRSRTKKEDKMYCYY